MLSMCLSDFWDYLRKKEGGFNYLSTLPNVFDHVIDTFLFLADLVADRLTDNFI